MSYREVQTENRTHNRGGERHGVTTSPPKTWITVFDIQGTPKQYSPLYFRGDFFKQEFRL